MTGQKRFIITEDELRHVESCISGKFTRNIRSRPAPQPDVLVDSILLAYMEDIIMSVKIMRDESNIVKRDANKTREKVYHDGSLMAYDRMIGYLERKKELRKQHGGEQR